MTDDWRVRRRKQARDGRDGKDGALVEVKDYEPDIRDLQLRVKMLENKPAPLMPVNDQSPTPRAIGELLERIEALEANATANKELGHTIRELLEQFSNDLGQNEGRIRTIEVKWDALKKLAGLEA